MTEQQPTADSIDMTWVLNRLAEEKAVRHAVLLTTDGLVLSVSEGAERALVERVSACASGIFSLGLGISEFAGPSEVRPRRIIFDWPEYCVLVFSAGHGTALAVAVEAEMTSSPVVVASSATIKAINGLRPALSARERTAYPSS